MKVVRRISGVSKFIVNGGNLFYEKDKLIFIDENEVEIKKLDCNFFGDFFVSNGCLILQSYHGQIFIDNRQYTGYYNYLNDKAITYLNTLDNLMHKVEIGVDHMLNVNGMFYQFGNICLVQNSLILSAASCLDYEALWQYNLETLGTYKNVINEMGAYEVKHFLGVYEEQLMVQLSNATFLFLDIMTGAVFEILHLAEQFPLFNPAFYDDNFKAHLADEKIIWLSNQRLLHIDLKTYAVEIIKDYFDEPKEEQYRFMSNTFHKSYLYFVADYGWQYVTPTIVGCMDANSGQVIWREQLKKTGGLPEAPQVTEDKLYIRTVNKELYIFEREAAGTASSS